MYFQYKVHSIHGQVLKRFIGKYKFIKILSLSGHYTCDLITNGFNSPNISILETNVTIWTVARQGHVSSNPLVVPFYPAVYFPSELKINERTFTAELYITGLKFILDYVTVSVTKILFFKRFRQSFI